MSQRLMQWAPPEVLETWIRRRFLSRAAVRPLSKFLPLLIRGCVSWWSMRPSFPLSCVVFSAMCHGLMTRITHWGDSGLCPFHIQKFLEVTLLLVALGRRGGLRFRLWYSIGYTLESLLAAQVCYGQVGSFQPDSGVVCASWSTSVKIWIRCYKWMPIWWLGLHYELNPRLTSWMLSTVLSLAAPLLLRPTGRTLALLQELGVKMMVMIGKLRREPSEFLVVSIRGSMVQSQSPFKLNVCILLAPLLSILYHTSMRKLHMLMNLHLNVFGMFAKNPLKLAFMDPLLKGTFFFRRWQLAADLFLWVLMMCGRGSSVGCFVCRRTWRETDSS